MIEGVELKQLARHYDERGYFQEIIRSTDDFFVGFGQWSVSVMYQGVIKAFHCHTTQYDYWFVPIGVIKAVLCDLRPGNKAAYLDKYPYYDKRNPPFNPPTDEYLLGDNQPAQVLSIPPGVAHGLKVLQGPAYLFYVTSHVYNPEDEGRIPFDALGYDWHKVEIK